MVNGGWRQRVLLGTVVAVTLALVAGALLPRVASAHGGRGGMFGGWSHDDGWAGRGLGGGVDRDALLAEALGISVEDLQAARAKAQETAIARALEKGQITQEQADLVLAQLAARSYLSQDALLADVLDVTVEELEAARDDGKSTRDLLDEKDLDPSTLRDKMDAARDKAIDRAVKDGAITAKQGEALKAADEGGCGFGPGGRHGAPAGHGMRGSGKPGTGTPETVTPGDEPSGTGLRWWGRGGFGSARMRVRTVTSQDA